MESPHWNPFPSSVYSPPTTTNEIFSVPSRFTSFNFNIGHVELPRKREKDFLISAFRLSVYSFLISFFVSKDMRLKSRLLPLTHSGVCEAPNVQTKRGF